jgi:hypothetical protein
LHIAAHRHHDQPLSVLAGIEMFGLQHLLVGLVACRLYIGEKLGQQGAALESRKVGDLLEDPHHWLVVAQVRELLEHQIPTPVSSSLAPCNRVRLAWRSAVVNVAARQILDPQTLEIALEPYPRVQPLEDCSSFGAPLEPTGAGAAKVLESGREGAYPSEA